MANAVVSENVFTSPQFSKLTSPSQVFPHKTQTQGPQGTAAGPHPSRWPLPVTRKVFPPTLLICGVTYDKPCVSGFCYHFKPTGQVQEQHKVLDAPGAHVRPSRPPPL